MDTSRLLFLVFMAVTPSECADTAELQCQEFDLESVNLLEGEAFFFVPYELDYSITYDEVTWYKNESGIEMEISSDENASVHHHGSALFFLNLHTEDSGFYIARESSPSGQCYNHHVKIDVFKSKMDSALLYGEIRNSDLNKKVACPDLVNSTCEILKGKLTWEKDFKPLQGRDETELWIYNASKNAEGIYTCTCFWTHNHKKYKSSGSRRLRLEEQTGHHIPEILSPASKEVFANEGSEIKLTCSVFCGINVQPHCHAGWMIDGILFSGKDGYSQTTKIDVAEGSKKTISTAVLTIDKVAAKDFQTQFTCVGEGLYLRESKSLTLKDRDTITPLIIGGVCLFVFFVIAAVLIKCFAIDLALLIRPCFSSRHTQDGSLYDAYVVYQMHGTDKATEDTLCQFIMKTLPAVLEDKCGYRLFIDGRDDVPGEGILHPEMKMKSLSTYPLADRLALVEDRMLRSKRLMVILNPGSGSGSGSDITDPPPESGFNCQVELHHALVQREMNVILIQIGDTGPEGYTHLPPGLQHLILKSAPIRWRADARDAAAWNSRFWKKVRYLMPATRAS